GDPLTYGATGLPAGLAISTSGQITGTPTTAGPNMVTVTAADGRGGEGQATFSWPIAAASVTVSGTVTFERPSYTSGNTLDFTNLQRLPVRGATVEILRASDQAVLATTTTDATSGTYSALVPSGSIIVRVKAQLLKPGAAGYDFEVRNNTSGNALYALDGSTVTPSGASVRVDLNAATGWGGTSYTGARAAAPFAILHMLWEARTLLQGAEPSLTLPPLDVHWSALNNASECASGQPDPTTGAIGTTFFIPSALPATAGCAATPPGIYVLGDANGTADDDADEFDSSVIAHELGHYFMAAFSRDDTMGGPHHLDARHDLSLAFSEGWGNAFQGFVLDSPWYRDTFGTAGSSSFAFDIENNTAPYQNVVENGFFAEASVQEFLWDAYDGANDEQIDLGYAPIHAVMRNEMTTTRAMTSIFVLATGLETRNPGQQAAIRSRLLAEGINGSGEFAANQTLPDALDLVPVYVPVSFGSNLPVTSTNRYADPGDTYYQSYNRLGSHRYLRIDLPSGGGLRIGAQGPVGSDPDFILYRQGVDQCQTAGAACWGQDDSTGSGLEEATFSGLGAGTYVLDVAECSYLGELCQPSVFGTNTVFTVTVTQQ
ncbi:MAG TPA: Ig domain-containing protein, partial [Xanthomonadales bacterium]|nr:Ig domain-containing protein [Xanthomonadales bacterium]